MSDILDLPESQQTPHGCHRLDQEASEASEDGEDPATETKNQVTVRVTAVEQPSPSVLPTVGQEVGVSSCTCWWQVTPAAHCSPGSPSTM